MKKFLKTGGLCLMLGLAFSCSSDDNKGGTPNEDEITLLVLDKMEEFQYDSSYNTTEEPGELALFSKIKTVFHYDEKGRVTVLDIDNEDEIPFPEESKSIIKCTLTYNDANQLTRVHSVGVSSGEDWIDEQFEYNAQGVLVQSVESVDNEVKHYVVNDKKQVVSLKVVTDHDYEEHYAYEYDAKGNVIRVTDVDNSSHFHTFTYDTNKTPYEHMNFNLMYENFDFTHYLNFLNLAKNNILSFEDSYGTWTIKHELNADGFPIESIGTMIKENRTERFVFKYTYKTIKIKK